MRAFGCSRRAVYVWLVEGAPPHVSLALRRLQTGELAPTGAAEFIKRARTRRDGNRYRR